MSMSDDYRRRMLAIADELHAQGVRPYTSAPPVYRLAWMLGLHIRPPLYQSFASLALGMGTWFGVLYGVLMWFMLWHSIGVTATGALTLFSGASYGLVMAGYYRWKAARLQLPPLES